MGKIRNVCIKMFLFELYFITVDSNALKVMHFSKGLVAKNKQYTGFYFTIRVWPVCV